MRYQEDLEIVSEKGISRWKKRKKKKMKVTGRNIIKIKEIMVRRRAD